MHPTAACDHLRHDHRQMEEYLDRLFAAVSHPGPELVSQVRGAIGSLQRLEAAHFEREESLFYPKLRPAFPDLLCKMDLQHEDVRELDHLVRSCCRTRRNFQRHAGRMNCAARASSCMIASNTTSLTRKINSSASRIAI
jgi:hypothetical protein